MSEHWYIYIAIAAVAYLLFWIFDKIKIIKSKPLRILIVILASTLLCYLTYDLVITIAKM